MRVKVKREKGIRISSRKGQERISKETLEMIEHSMENFDKAVPITIRTNREKIKKIFDKFGIKEEIYIF